MLFLGAMLFAILAPAQSNIAVRIMAANLNGNTQSYQPFAIRIFQGLKPDIVAIQEFNYSNNTPRRFSVDGGHRFRHRISLTTVSLTPTTATFPTASSADIRS